MKKINQDDPKYWNMIYSGEPYQDRTKNDREYWVKFIDNVIGRRKKLHILEIGCAIGDYTDKLREKGHRIKGIDYSNKAIELAKQRYPKTCYEVEDVRDMNYNKEFDVIIAFEVLEHFKNPIPILYKIYKALKPKGIFMFSLPYDRGRFGDTPEHFTLWNYDSTFMTLCKFWNVVCYHKVHSVCLGFNMFGYAKNEN